MNTKYRTKGKPFRLYLDTEAKQAAQSTVVRDGLSLSEVVSSLLRLYSGIPRIAVDDVVLSRLRKTLADDESVTSRMERLERSVLDMKSAINFVQTSGDGGVVIGAGCKVGGHINSGNMGSPPAKPKKRGARPCL